MTIFKLHGLDSEDATITDVEERRKKLDEKREAFSSCLNSILKQVHIPENVDQADCVDWDEFRKHEEKKQAALMNMSEEPVAPTDQKHLQHIIDFFVKNKFNVNVTLPADAAEKKIARTYSPLL